MSARGTDRTFGTLAAPRRNRFYHGKLMGVPQADTEQLYVRLRQALMNRLSLGKGVLCGLSIRAERDTLLLGPGVAVDGLGREIVVAHTARIDPWDGHSGSCCCGDRKPRPRDESHLVTIALCYGECLADHASALVDDCAGSAACEADTVVESYCICLSDGAPPPQLPSPGCQALREHDPRMERDARIALRRELLCQMLDDDCAAAEDPCVPLATVELTADGTIGAMTVCPVRQRLYSNETLLELILCLADRIEECCSGHPEPHAAFRVAAVRWIATGTDGSATELKPDLPLFAAVPRRGEPRDIDIDFTADVDPRSVLPDDVNTPIAAHTVRVTFLDSDMVLQGVATLIGPRTIRYRPPRDLLPGKYLLQIFGTDDPATGRGHLTDTAANALDGEPGGLPSGDNVAGGDFAVDFAVV